MWVDRLFAGLLPLFCTNKSSYAFYLSQATAQGQKSWSITETHGRLTAIRWLTITNKTRTVRIFNGIVAVRTSAIILNRTKGEFRHIVTSQLPGQNIEDKKCEIDGQSHKPNFFYSKLKGLIGWQYSQYLISGMTTYWNIILTNFQSIWFENEDQLTPNDWNNNWTFVLNTEPWHVCFDWYNSCKKNIPTSSQASSSNNLQFAVPSNSTPSIVINFS